MIVRCPRGLGDSACILPKLPGLLEQQEQIEQQASLTYLLEGYYPELLCSMFKNFDFYVPTKFVQFLDSEQEFGLVEGERVIEADEASIHHRLTDIQDRVIPEYYWKRPPTREELSVRREPPVRRKPPPRRVWSIPDRVYSVVVHLTTTLRTPRRFESVHLRNALATIISSFPSEEIVLVGTYLDYLSIQDIVDQSGVDSRMGLWSIEQVVQSIFCADVVVGCDSWIVFLAGIIGKRSAMYILGKHQLSAMFRDRVVSTECYGFDNINIDILDMDRVCTFLKGTKV